VPKALEEIWAEEAAPSIVPIVPFVPVPVPSISLVPPPASAAPAAPAAPAVAPKKAELQGFELEFVSIARAVSAASGDAASDLLLAPSAASAGGGISEMPWLSPRSSWTSEVEALPVATLAS
jgi:hypothetical protein